MANSARTNSRSGWTFWSGILAMLLVLYLLAWGPVAWMLQRWNPSPKGAIGRSVIVLFYPHLWAMSRSQWYFGYSIWWVMLADGSRTAPSFDEYQLRFQTIQSE